MLQKVLLHLPLERPSFCRKGCELVPLDTEPSNMSRHIAFGRTRLRLGKYGCCHPTLKVTPLGLDHQVFSGLIIAG